MQSSREIRYEAVEKMCRCCMMSEMLNSRSLYKNDLPEEFEWITSIKINPQDGLPQSMCISCFKILQQCIQFKNMCIASDNELKNRFKLYELNKDTEMHTITKTIQQTNEFDASENSMNTNPCHFSNDNVPPLLYFNTREIVDSDDQEEQCSIPTVNVETMAQKSSLNCSICFTSFSNSNEFNAHMQIPHVPNMNAVKHENEINIIDCPKDEQLNIPETVIFRNTAVKNQPKKRAKHIENGETDTYSNPNHYDEVLQSKRSREKVEFVCNRCSAVLSTAESFVRHLDVHKVATFDCAVCLDSFLTLGELEMHIGEHLKQADCQCRICEKNLLDKDDLLIHMHTKHKELAPYYKPYQCDFCVKTFRFKINLIEHRKIHTDGQMYTCPICSKMYMDEGYLNRHFSQHSELLKCRHCGKVCRNKAHMEQIRKENQPQVQQPKLTIKCVNIN